MSLRIVEDTLVEGIRVLSISLVEADPVSEKEALAWLRDEAELSRWKKCLPQARRYFSFCRAALRRILCDTLDCRNEQLSFEYSYYGKPYALVDNKPANIAFNVSHSGKLGVIAVAPTGPLGVDVEEIVSKRQIETLIDTVMGDEERAEFRQLQGAARLRRFFRLWACKEALIKALGTGCHTDISKFQIPVGIRKGETTTATFRFPHLPTVSWRLKDLSGKEYATALAYELPTERPPAEPENHH